MSLFFLFSSSISSWSWFVGEPSFRSNLKGGRVEEEEEEEKKMKKKKVSYIEGVLDIFNVAQQDATLWSSAVAEHAHMRVPHSIVLCFIVPVCYYTIRPTTEAPVQHGLSHTHTHLLISRASVLLFLYCVMSGAFGLQEWLDPKSLDLNWAQKRDKGGLLFVCLFVCLFVWHINV